jgi:LysM repeat protein
LPFLDGEITMGKKRFLLILAILLLASLLAACTQPASTPPGPTATPAELDLIYSQAKTSTAQAMTDGEGGGESQSTPAPGDTQQPSDATPQDSQPVIVTSTPEVEPTNTPVTVSDITVPNNYKLRKGEHPYCIARRFDIDVISLLNYNGLGMGGYYPEGLKLKIPKDAPGFPGDRFLLKHPTTYTVRAGDTLYTIACAFGDVAPEQIAEANGKGKNWTPAAGDKIHIP